ncbi:MAG: cation diffusion facilitator family transporter [Candidatus Omnitrophica bacterium]|nr:cation diffusion facilitator family transporter [Candidatus Omnitrophota bacterium]
MPTINKDAALEVKRLQMLSVRVSIAGSIILFLISASVGIIVDSITLILDASSNLVILAVAFLMNFAVNKIHKPADERYNFGYGKYEPFTASIQGILIFATCIFAIKFAIQDIVHAEDIKNHFLPMAATFVASILGLFITIYLKRLSGRSGSSMLRASCLHWQMDTVLSFGVCFGFLIGLFLQREGYYKMTPYVDPVMAIILAFILIWAPFKTVIHNIRELLDAAPKGQIHARIKKIVEKRKPEHIIIHRIRTRRAGEKIFLDIIFDGKEDLTLAQAEELTGILETDIKADLGNCDILISFRPHGPAASANIPA